MRDQLQQLLNLQWKVVLPEQPWVTLQHTGPVYDLRGHDSIEDALTYCGEWNFVSRIILQPDTTRPVYPVGDTGTVQQGWDWDWLAVWLRMEDRAFEALVAGERLKALPRQLTVAGLQSDTQTFQTRAQ
jgi:hypothetical protein